MISKSPEIIDYISVSDVFSDGETIETKTIISGIRCSVQQGGNNYKMNINGNDIVYSHFISITEPNEMIKVPEFGISDEVEFNGKRFKILSQRKRQLHIEIYV